MKIILLSFLTFYCTIVIGQESGMYRDNIHQNELNVVVSEQTAEITGWNYKVLFNKNAEGIYVSEYGSVLTSGKDRSLIVTGKNGHIEIFNLYAPITYTLPEGVKDYKIGGKTYFYISGVNEQGLIGEYLYEGKSEPKVLLSADGTGYFQRHMRPVDGFEWWGVETNYKGEVQKVTYENGSYKLIIAMKYKNGTYDRSQAVVVPEKRKTYFLGERILSW
jgi:hypothetical protein